MMKPKAYELFLRCLDDGVDWGFKRAFKYTDSPDEHTIKENIKDEIMNQLYEWFSFENEVKDE